MYSLTQATELFLEKYLEWTSNWKSKLVKKFNAHKVRHSMWVLECWRMILLFMKQNWFHDKELFNKAEIIFILHDIARMFQNDWNEILSTSFFDHWTKWYKILKDSWLYDNMICLSIKYHDKYSIDWLYNESEFLSLSDKDKEDTIFLSKLIRDADKVQNMVYSIFEPEDYFFNFWMNLIDWKISQVNFEKIKEKALIWRISLITKIDWLIDFFSRIHDIYFVESLELLKSFNYYDEMINIIKKLDWCDDDLIAELEKYYKPVFN